jgi:hypothetical protein
MSIDKLIKELYKLKTIHGGETKVVYQTLSHVFPVELEIRKAVSGTVVLVNP